MEVVKCGLCKEEIKYSQRCRVYIKSDEPRNAQRISKRPHIGRYKIISTAPSTEHISFARRLKSIRNKEKSNNSEEVNSTDEPNNKVAWEEEKLKSTKEGEVLEKDKKENTLMLQAKSKLKESRNTLTKFSKSESKKTANTNNISSEVESTSKVMSHPHFQSSFEEYIKPILSKTAAKITKTKSSDSNSDLEVNRKGAGNTYQPTKNGSRGNSLKEFETYFWLEMPKPKMAEPRKLAYQFENLVSEVKHMKLPSSEWKIKIMVHKKEMVSVSFSNKQNPEKLVSVNAKSSVCDITIDNKKLVLVGSPVYIYSIKDLETLLDIVNDIDPESPLIEYF